MARPFSRRAFAQGAVGLGGALALGGCAPRREAAGGRWAGRFLTVATGGGALGRDLQAALFVPFTRATGCRVAAVELPPDALVAELRRQFFTAKIEWDAVVLDAPRLLALAQAEPRLFARPADRALAWRDPPTAALRAVGVPLLTDTLTPLYRAAPFAGRPPASWAELWDVARSPEPRAFPRDPIGLFAVALLAAGADPAELSPLDLDRAFAALDRVRPAIRDWWTIRDRGVDDLLLGEVDLLLARGGDARAALASGAHVAVAPVAVPALPQIAALPDGGINAAPARDLVATALGAAVQATFAAQGYWPALATAPDPAESPATVALDLAWWAAAGEDALARFAVWLGQ